jgi:Asp-tRNA(Asn)/Glu-tRNA(Gln) amidotransferase A subunit family amidase
MSSRSETQETLQREIRAEKAGALARAVEQLEAALAALASHDQGDHPSPSPSPRERGEGRERAVREELLADARERLWYVVIQREAMGLRRHEVLYDVLRVPREVRFGMGPRRRAR